MKTMNQKFLLKGHTHIEADTVHANIERIRKRTAAITILTPWDCQQLDGQCSKKYSVINVETEYFKNYQTV